MDWSGLSCSPAFGGIAGWPAHRLLGSIGEVLDYATRWLCTYNHERPGMAIGGGIPKRTLPLAAWPLRSGRYKNGAYALDRHSQSRIRINGHNDAGLSRPHTFTMRRDFICA